jgi:hypothetical protein
VQDRAAEAIETGDLQRVAVAQDPRDLVELGTAGFGAAGVVEVDVVRVDAGAFERVDLVVGILVSGRDSRVAEQQAVENTGWAEIFVVVSRRGLSTLSGRKSMSRAGVSANDRFSSTRARPPSSRTGPRPRLGRIL